MGLICELYVIDDDEIKLLINSPNEFEDYLCDKYGYIDGDKHFENETVFSMDKAWDIAKFLIKKNDFSETKISDKLDGKPILENSYSGYNYIFSKDVVEVNKIISSINSDGFKKLTKQELMENEVYRVEMFRPENLEYLIYHLDTYQKAFAKAVEKGSGIVISLG